MRLQQKQTHFFQLSSLRSASFVFGGFFIVWRSNEATSIDAVIISRVDIAFIDSIELDEHCVRYENASLALINPADRSRSSSLRRAAQSRLEMQETSPSPSAAAAKRRRRRGRLRSGSGGKGNSNTIQP